MCYRDSSEERPASQIEDKYHLGTTPDVGSVYLRANEEACLAGAVTVRPIHLLLALVDPAARTSATTTLKQLGYSISDLYGVCASDTLEEGPEIPTTGRFLKFTPATLDAIQHARRHYRSTGHKRLDTDDLLYGVASLIRTKDRAACTLAKALHVQPTPELETIIRLAVEHHFSEARARIAALNNL